MIIGADLNRLKAILRTSKKDKVYTKDELDITNVEPIQMDIKRIIWGLDRKIKYK